MAGVDSHHLHTLNIYLIFIIESEYLSLILDQHVDRYDIIAQLRHARKLAEKLQPAARMLELHGGHLVSHERPDEVCIYGACVSLELLTCLCGKFVF